MYLNHFIVQQKLTQHYKSTIFQWHFKKDKKKKKMLSDMYSPSPLPYPLIWGEGDKKKQLPLTTMSLLTEEADLEEAHGSSNWPEQSSLQG